MMKESRVCFLCLLFDLKVDVFISVFVRQTGFGSL